MSKNGAGYDPAVEDIWPLEDRQKAWQGLKVNRARRHHVAISPEAKKVYGKTVLHSIRFKDDMDDFRKRGCKKHVPNWYEALFLAYIIAIVLLYWLMTR